MAKKGLNPLSQEDLAALLQQIADVSSALSGGDSLRPSDRQKLPKSGRKTVQFVQQALEISQQNPSLVAQYIDLTAMEQNFLVYNQMLTLKPMVDQLKRRVEDAMLVAGSNSYITALRCYKGFKIASNDNIPGAQPVYETLKTRFKPVKRKPGAGEAGDLPEAAFN
jgi:hypothetical protein